MFTNHSRSIKSLQNVEKGKRVFILGNGPSVAKEDLSFLKDELVIGMNASTILDTKHGFFSKYYVVSDTRFLAHPDKKKFGMEELHKDTIRVFRSELEAYDDDQYKDRTFYVNAIGRDGVSSNLNNGFFFGSTTTMLAIQLALYLGATEIYLLGVDLRYSKDSPRFYEEKEPQLEDSFTSVQIKNIYDSSIYCKEHDIKMFNCSERSFLKPYLPFKKFSTIFEKEKFPDIVFY